MALQDALTAMTEFTKVVHEAHDMATAGATGEVLEEAIQHCEELLTIVDEELRGYDPTGQAAAAAGAPEMRTRLEAIRARLRSGKA